MVTYLSAVELCYIDRMTRPELLDALRPRLQDLPPDQRRDLDGQPLDRLRLLLLAARLLFILRHPPAAE